MPASIGIIPAKTRNNVVLPAPFGPTKPRICPFLSDRFIEKIPEPFLLNHGLVSFGLGILWRNVTSNNSITMSAMVRANGSTMTN